MTKPLRLAVAGFGWAAAAHIDAFKHVEGVEIAAVYSGHTKDREAVDAACGRPVKLYNDFAALAADPDIDMVDITSRHSDHFDQAMAAVRAGKHVLIEKPICLELEQGLALRDAIREAGVQGGVCFECRYSKHHQLIRDVIDQGFLGDVHYGEVDYFHGIGDWSKQYPWNRQKAHGGSSMLTAGCHALDALLFFMNEPVKSVYCVATQSTKPMFQKYEYPTTSTVLLTFESGRVGKVASCIDCIQPYYLHVHLVGSEGAVLDDRWYSDKIFGMSKERWSKFETTLLSSGDVREHPYLPQFEAFAEAVRTGKPMPRTDYETALETHRVIWAAEKSLAEGRPVEMSEMPA